VPESFSRPVPQILHGLGRGGVVEPAESVVTADDAHDLDIDDVWRGVVGIRRQAETDALGERSIGDDLVQA